MGYGTTLAGTFTLLLGFGPMVGYTQDISVIEKWKADNGGHEVDYTFAIVAAVFAYLAFFFNLGFLVADVNAATFGVTPNQLFQISGGMFLCYGLALLYYVPYKVTNNTDVDSIAVMNWPTGLGVITEDSDPKSVFVSPYTSLESVLNILCFVGAAFILGGKFTTATAGRTASRKRS